MDQGPRFIYNQKGLKDIQKNMDLLSKYKVRVGIMGRKVHRDDKFETHAEIGAKHEFGAGGFPARSFLRKPLSRWIEGEDSKKSSKTIFKLFDKSEFLLKFLSSLGVLGVRKVLHAFSTSGDGSWAPNSPVTVGLKGSDKPLIDTGTLRRAIVYMVVNESGQVVREGRT